MPPTQGPSCCLVVENRSRFEVRRGVTLLANPIAEKARRMRVLMAGDATRYGDGAELPFSKVTFLALGLLMSTGEGESSLLLVIEPHTGVQLVPVITVVTAIAAVQIGLCRGPMVGAVT